jgi:type II secretory pathway component PulC
VLQSINGFPLTSPEAMFQAYASLHAAERMRLVVVRAGQTIELDYEIR